MAVNADAYSYSYGADIASARALGRAMKWAVKRPQALAGLLAPRAACAAGLKSRTCPMVTEPNPSGRIIARTITQLGDTLTGNDIGARINTQVQDPTSGDLRR